MEPENSQNTDSRQDSHSLPKIKHFIYDMPLSEKTTIQPYVSQHKISSSRSKKNHSKHKYDEFMYYRLKESQEIIKVLYRNEHELMLHSKYPFTDPLDQMITTKYMSQIHPIKIIKAEAAYIGHYEETSRLLVKKLSGVTLNKQATQLETHNDDFEEIQMQNEVRFAQIVKILKNLSKAPSMSVRVIIDETNVEAPKVLDYEFFKREEQIKKNSKVYNQSNAKQI